MTRKAPPPSIRPVPDTDWMADGSCAARRDLPWLQDGKDITAWEDLTMRWICEECPVRQACQAFVRDAKISGGFWAGHHRGPHGALPGLEVVA